MNGHYVQQMLLPGGTETNHMKKLETQEQQKLYNL